MGQMSFDCATHQLHQVNECSKKVDYTDVAELEIVVLDYVPATADEAVTMLDVAIPNLEFGGRSDGRDIAALRRIRTMLSEWSV